VSSSSSRSWRYGRSYAIALESHMEGNELADKRLKTRIDILGTGQYAIQNNCITKLT
jgi:hypothetical protein